jgi:hypothetical protein
MGAGAPPPISHNQRTQYTSQAYNKLPAACGGLVGRVRPATLEAGGGATARIFGVVFFGCILLIAIILLLFTRDKSRP